MFHWYERSDVSYMYISDMLPDEELSHGLTKSRWITRGWTLQELIAPRTISFFDRDWSKRDVDGSICDITQIEPEVLYGRRTLSSVPISPRMSWAASRVTTRVEDRAYSLLGIFGVNMPVIYSEGPRAFIRLQHEMIKITNDLSIFAWIPSDEQISMTQEWRQQCHLGIGLLAAGPEPFTHSQPIERIIDSDFDGEYSLTNSNIKVVSRLRVYTNPEDGRHVYFIGLGYRLLGERVMSELGMDLCQCGPNMFSRISRSGLSLHPNVDVDRTAT